MWPPPEANDRRWTSRTHRSRSGLLVLSLTHPGVANSKTAKTDPSALVLRALKQQCPRVLEVVERTPSHDR